MDRLQVVSDMAKKIFLKYVVSQRPVLLLIDGHKSHITVDAIDLCQENDIILFCLPPYNPCTPTIRCLHLQVSEGSTCQSSTESFIL